MSFNEKLQYLRKENKLSQEQLADMLDVTRQSVSKWESGTTYPEMDKLIMLCKIFKCSLDDLTNDEITEIKEVDKKNTNNNILGGLLDSLLDIMLRTVKMFRAMSFKQTVGCIMSLLFIALLLCLLRIPFDLLESGFYNVVKNIGRPAMIGFLTSSFNLVVDIINFALYLMIFFHIYKEAYLNKYEFVESTVSVEEQKKVKEEAKEIKIVKEENPNNNTLFKMLGGLVVGFVKFLIAFLSLPAIFLLMSLFILLVIDLYCLVEGITFFGILFGIIFMIVLTIWFLELIAIFLFNKKASFKRMVWTFIISVAGVGLSTGIFVLEISNIEYINGVPSDFKKISTVEEFEMKNNFAILDYRYYYNSTINYVEDETLKNKVLIELKYYDEFIDMRIEETYNGYEVIPYYYDSFAKSKKFLEYAKKDLRNGKFHNYYEINNYSVIVKSSKDNLEIIKHNNRNAIEKLNNNRYCNYDNYNNIIDDYENQIDVLDDRILELQEKINELEEYKERVQDLIGE